MLIDFGRRFVRSSHHVEPTGHVCRSAGHRTEDAATIGSVSFTSLPRLTAPIAAVFNARRSLWAANRYAHRLINVPTLSEGGWAISVRLTTGSKLRATGLSHLTGGMPRTVPNSRAFDSLVRRTLTRLSLCHPFFFCSFLSPFPPAVRAAIISIDQSIRIRNGFDVWSRAAASTKKRKEVQSLANHLTSGFLVRFYGGRLSCRFSFPESFFILRHRSLSDKWCLAHTEKNRHLHQHQCALTGDFDWLTDQWPVWCSFSPLLVLFSLPVLLATRLVLCRSLHNHKHVSAMSQSVRRETFFRSTRYFLFHLWFLFSAKWLTG